MATTVNDILASQIGSLMVQLAMLAAENGALKERLAQLTATETTDATNGAPQPHDQGIFIRRHSEMD